MNSCSISEETVCCGHDAEPAPESVGPRIVVTGMCASGKTTFARRLSRMYGLPHVELDALNWDPNWTMVSREVFRDRVDNALKGSRWATDGGYLEVRDLTWQRATDLFWLDLPLRIILWRLFTRTVRRVWTQEELWNGNRETWRGCFFSRDSLFVYVLQTFWKRRRRIRELLQEPQFAALRVRRFRTPKQAAHWLAEADEAKASGRKARIGVYGGTFDPIHNVHLEIARAALREAELDRVLFVVSARPPHKRNRTSTSAEDRFAMVAAAIADEPKMEASRLEMERTGPSYTADTLRQLKEQHPDAELFLIVGVDSLVDIPRWREPETIYALATLLALPRPGSWAIPPEIEGKYRILEFKPSPVSSTEVRQRIYEGEPLDNMVPEAVKQYIVSKGLYDAEVPDASR